jgi:hypothetical protein
MSFKYNNLLSDYVGGHQKQTLHPSSINSLQITIAFHLAPQVTRRTYITQQHHVPLVLL